MIVIDGHHLSIENVVAVAVQREKVSLNDTARTQIKNASNAVQKIIQNNKPVYGINTGFGIFSNKHISNNDIEKLNRNLILSHAVATGPELPVAYVRAAMLIRANTLASGYSGIRLELVENLVKMINHDLIPCIPSQGSMGSSGDLAPLSHIALVLSADENDYDEESGWALYQGERLSGKAAMNKAGIDRLVLGPKESLALTNGATFSAAMAVLAIAQAKLLLDSAETALAMSLEALLGASAAFDEKIHSIRRHSGQQLVAKNIRSLTQGSTLLDAEDRVQDAYSLRCAPQVQGPARETVQFVEAIIEKEINAVTDNPIIFNDQEALSGGNFHGEPMAMAMDFLKIAMAEVAAISERRIFQLTDTKMNAGLPAMLVNSTLDEGLNSGMMMPQYTAASLVLENQHLANPNSVHSLPTSGGKEDHNANSMTAARNALQLLENCNHVIAIELYTAARAIDIRLKQLPHLQMGVGVANAHKAIREKVPYKAEDNWWGPEIEQVKVLLKAGKFKV